MWTSVSSSIILCCLKIGACDFFALSEILRFKIDLCAATKRCRWYIYVTRYAPKNFCIIIVKCPSRHCISKSYINAWWDFSKKFYRELFSITLRDCVTCSFIEIHFKDSIENTFWNLFRYFTIKMIISEIILGYSWGFNLGKNQWFLHVFLRVNIQELFSRNQYSDFFIRCFKNILNNFASRFPMNSWFF